MKLNVTEGDGFVMRCLHFCFFSPPNHLGISMVNISRVPHVALNQQAVFFFNVGARMMLLYIVLHMTLFAGRERKS